MKKLFLCFCVVCIFSTCKKDDEVYTTKNVSAAQPAIVDTTFTMTIFPNPCNNFANVQLKFPRASTLKITIYDKVGAIVSLPNTTFQLAMGQNTIGFNTFDFQQGIYIVVAEYDTGNVIGRMVVAH